MRNHTKNKIFCMNYWGGKGEFIQKTSAIAMSKVHFYVLYVFKKFIEFFSRNFLEMFFLDFFFLEYFSSSKNG